MKAVSYNPRNRGHRKALYPGAPQGSAWHQLYTGKNLRLGDLIGILTHSFLMIQPYLSYFSFEVFIV